MFDVFTSINTELWLSIEKGEIDLKELQRIRWNRIFESLGISADGIAFEKYFRQCLFESAIEENGALDLVKYLYGKYILCAVSNGPYLQQVNRLRLGGMLPYFTHLFISEEIGYSKPSQEFFTTCMSRLNEKNNQEIMPCDIMIIGDSLSADMAGGIKMGMQTCYYNPHNKSIPCKMNIDYIVTSLKDIEYIL